MSAKSFYILEYNHSYMRSINIFLIAIMVLISCLVITSAAVKPSSLNNATYEKITSLCLNDSLKIKSELMAENFSILKVNDTLKQAQALYDSQIVLRETKKTFDFGIVISYCDEIKKIRQDAFVARDQYLALLQFYNDQKAPGMNTSSIDSMLSEINLTMSEERYEEVLPMIDKANNEIIKVTSEYTALNVFLDYTTQSIGKFLAKNWKILAIIFSFFLILFLIYRIKILRWLVQRKIENLKIRKNTIKELIMKTQKAYFQSGTIPETEYNIKTKKFAEFIRDIDRQVPLLQEQFVKFGGKIRDQ
jgi:hypothetical protein